MKTFAWSQKGRLLAFVKQGNLSVQNFDRGSSRRVSPNFCSSALSFAPDGTRLICGAVDGEQVSVRLVNLKSGRTRTLLEEGVERGAFAPEHPAWASDGTIAAQPFGD